MVFATEFDPIHQSARVRTSAKQSTAQSHINSATPSLTNGTTLVNESLANVVPLQPSQAPLHLGNPAVRVQINSDQSLSLPKRPKLSLGLQILNRLQQGSTVLTTLLVTGALAIYGSTVYIDKSTDRALVELDTLQGESQQLTSANEAIKQSLAQQAIKKDSGLEPYEAGDVLFLTPESLRESHQPAAPTAELPGPLGY